VRRARVLLTSALAPVLLASCTGGDGDAEEPTPPPVTATPQGGEPAEEDVRAVLEEMGVTGIGVVGTPGRGEAFLYGQVGGNRSVVVHSVRTGQPAAGRTVDTVELAGTEVALVRTRQFGLVGRFGCGRDTVDVWVRRGDQTMSRDRGAVEEQAAAYVAAADCG
jgi:hypothetical protein